MCADAAANRDGRALAHAGVAGPARDRRSRRRAGFSLIELVIALVVISVALTGTLLVVDTTTKRSAEPMLERAAISIAESYLDEALGKAYRDPQSGDVCPGPEARRALFDNVCDFDGLAETGARTATGAAIAGLDSFRVELDVDRGATLGGLSGVTQVLRVDARVTDPLGRPVLLSGYRTAP